MSDVIIDACCLINLLSSGRPADILRGGGDDFHVCTAVAEEALFVEEFGADQTRQRTRVNLEPLFQSGAIKRCKPETAEELAAFVRYAASVDDGEAMCLALAKCRSWVVATDDRKGRRVATNEGIAVKNTIEVLRRWAKENNVTEALVRELVTRISTLGRYRPKGDIPSVQWWRDNGGDLLI